MSYSQLRSRSGNQKRSARFLFLIVWIIIAATCTSTKPTLEPAVIRTNTPEATVVLKSATSPVVTTTLAPQPTSTPTPVSTNASPKETQLPCPQEDTLLPDPDFPLNYIGRSYDPFNLPEGLEWMGGSVIFNKYGEITEYSLTDVMWKQERVLFWLEKAICHDNDGKSYDVIVDAIASPPIKIDQPPWFAGKDRITGWCFQGDKELPHVIAIGTYDEDVPAIAIGKSWGQRMFKLSFAFLIDTAKMKFVELNPDTLECYEDVGAGYPGP
jgi:hypothetical protein